jgi:hypothetical protein
MFEHLHAVPGGTFRLAEIESLEHTVRRVYRFVRNRTGPVPQTLFPELDGAERWLEFQEPLALCAFSERLQEYATDTRVHILLRKRAAADAHATLWFGLHAARDMCHRYGGRCFDTLFSTGPLGVVHMSAYPECAVTWELDRFQEYAVYSNPDVYLNHDVWGAALTSVQ